MPITEAMSVPSSSNTKNFDQLKNQSRPRRRRCSTWNHTSTIPIEESDTNAEHLVKGEALVCVSKDGSTLMVSKLVAAAIQIVTARYQKNFESWLKYFWRSLYFYKMNTDNDALLKF